ncbi:Tfp pilus assembly protein, ATPase PilM [Neorhodopirellula lusitana]|uniref:Tfp pilus assembly protein, ATPase PilM n=1 Tax=Neorhodopirellula lusitana TaxID=445327 RepID=A0ABY1QD88_9BACT|nr:pilus assembly protein PilM [Neorhodopirellula lusitana]SMP66034.1 Tfp pilus assembly protein, ATPase PilM [Neorhodopirellula lusitana]
MSVSESPAATLQCGACQHANAGAAQFCVSCGHSLYESCKQCSGPVTLTQKFCVACGTDLSAWLAERNEANEKRLAEAVAAAKSHDYERSLTMLKSLADVKDFRFAKHAATAHQASGKIQALRDRVVGDATSRIEQARQLFDRGDHAKAVAVLSPLPDRLLDDASRNILNTGRQHLGQLAELQKELQQALAQKDYLTAMGLNCQLLELQPDNEQYLTFSRQLGAKLIRRAEKLYARQDFAAANDMLSGLPDLVRSEAYYKLKDQIETANWLSGQFKDEPFAYNNLGRLALRFSKEVPGSGHAADLVKQLKEAVKGKRKSRRDLYSEWTGNRRSWAGGRVGVLGQVESLDLESVESPVSSYGPYAVAIGLALQGVGHGRVTDNMVIKKGMFSKIAKGKSKLAWGFDVGAAGVRVVCLEIEKGKSKPILRKCMHVDFETPLCRGGKLRSSDSDEVVSSLKSLLEQIELTGAAVWCNLPAYETVGRFCELPPVNDKDADKMVAAEARGRIPIDKDDLALVTWRSNFDKKVKVGRPLMMAAATRVAVQRRVDLLGLGGLTAIDGMVPDAVALANFAAYEFADLLNPTSSDGDDDEVNSEPPESLLGAKQQPTVAIICAGASMTTMVLVSPISIWYWSHESGGEDVTSSVARETKLTSKQAEQAKRNLAALDCPGRVDDVIEQKQVALKRRLSKLLQDAQATFDHMDVQQVWCVGQAHQQHGFLRRVMT